MTKFASLIMTSMLYCSVYHGAVVAQNTDVNAPIEISAKSTFVDGVSKMSVYKDAVVVKQGSLQILADSLSIDASAGEGLEVFIASGNPASFEQTLPDGTRVTAAAQEIRYSVVTRKIKFSGAAQLAQDTSVVTSDTIVFDLINKQLIANAAETQGGRVTTVFQPEVLQQQLQETEDAPQGEQGEDK